MLGYVDPPEVGVLRASRSCPKVRHSTDAVSDGGGVVESEAMSTSYRSQLSKAALKVHPTQFTYLRHLQREHAAPSVSSWNLLTHHRSTSTWRPLHGIDSADEGLVALIPKHSLGLLTHQDNVHLIGPNRGWSGAPGGPGSPQDRSLLEPAAHRGAARPANHQSVDQGTSLIRPGVDASRRKEVTLQPPRRRRNRRA